jgi:hypothetical protein
MSEHEPPVDPEITLELAEENARLRAELDATEAKNSEVRRARRGRVRNAVVVLLVVLTSLSVLASTVGVWVNRTVWNTDNYLKLVTPLAEDPAVTNALAVRVTDEVFEALNLDQRVSDAIASIPKLPAQAAFIAGPLTAAMRNVVLKQVQTFFASQTFRDLWVSLNTEIHGKIVALLQGNYSELPNVSISGGQVQLNLIPVVAQVIQRVITALGINLTLPSIPASVDVPSAIQLLSSHLGVTLPPDFAQITIMSQHQLSTYQTAAQNLRKLGYALVILTLVLGALAIVLSTRRRRTIVWLGVGTALALLLGGPTIRAIQRQVENAITDPGARSAATDVFAQVTNGLRRIGWVIIVIAALAALIAYLSGRPAWFETAKAKARSGPQGSELETFAARNADGVRLGGIAIAILLLIVVGIGWLSIIVLGVLVALLLWGVATAERRAAAREGGGEAGGTAG